MVLINLPHSLSTVRLYATVKEVRAHSEKGDAAVPRVVGTVVALPCCGMGDIASVMSWVRAPCGGSLAAQVEWGLVPESGRGRARRNLTSEALPEGSGESELVVRGPGGSVELNELGPVPR